ncbi:MAG: multidrug ABC transporter ATP-binding protein, partial [Chloroflexi bacterium]
LPYLKNVQAIDNKLLVALDEPEAHNPNMIRLLVDAGADIHFVGEIRHSLEDVYLQLVNNEAKEDHD